MVNPEDIAERFWSRAQKPSEEARREQFFLDDVIHKAHFEREIGARLEGVGMIERAHRDAAEAGVAERMTFRQGRLADIGGYATGQFDLVICSDAPVSYVYPEHASAIQSLVGVCGKAIVLSVSSRFGYVSLALNPRQKEPYFADPDSDDPLVRFYREEGHASLVDQEPALEAAWRAFRTGLMRPTEDTDREFQAGRAPWPHNYLFEQAELKALLKAQHVTDIRLSGPGALSRGLPNEVLRLLLSHRYRRKFLDLCFEFDSKPSVCGLGKDNLVASGRVVRGS
jgi:hypothetical protein